MSIETSVQFNETNGWPGILFDIQMPFCQFSYHKENSVLEESQLFDINPYANVDSLLERGEARGQIVQ